MRLKINPKVYAEGTKGALKSSLDYQLLAESDKYFLLEINPHTGRHHQIRVQLANMGCPIKGDLKYGAKRSNADGSISLHARGVSLIHPVKKELLSITAPVPNDNLWPRPLKRWLLVFSSSSLRP